MTDDGDAGGSDRGADAVPDADVSVRIACDDETDAVRRLLDAALLTVPSGLPDRVAGGDTLVAVTAGDGAGPADVVGALVLDGGHVETVAVRRSRRATGIGTALVAAAAERVDEPLTAAFRPGVRPFYEALGFEVAERDGRLFGTLPADTTVTR